ncbi:hypothetical protein BKA70DRAFT_1513966 [Coprinopsis sp. MPI-PUGE-AT-0042]|nr:hypothetical protein BKA70DRAFT_1513966 [Coprinopsis sp. MPI-PUGE-AT-0042]
MTADKVKSALDDITKWLSFAVSNNPASYLGGEFGTDCGFMYLASRTAMNLGALHEGPDSFAAYANQALVDLLIEIWLKKNGDVDFNFPERGPPSDYYIWRSPGPRGLIDRAPGQGCWLISVIRCLVNTPELSTLFCHRWLSRCTAGGLDPSALFISTIHSRLTQSVSASDMGKDLLYGSVCDITALSHLIHCVTVPYLKDRTKQPRWGPTHLQALYKSGNVCKFTKAIRCLSDQCLEMEVTDGFPEPEGTAFEPVVLCAKVIDDLFIKDLNTFPNAISNSFRTLVRHGLLQIAVTRTQDSFYHHRHRAWHILLVLEHYRQKGTFEQYHLHQPPNIGFHIDLKQLPSRTVGFPVEEYPEDFKTSMIKVHDQRLVEDFLPWAATRAREQRLPGGAIQMERLIQGLWRFGGRSVVVDIKVRVKRPLRGELEVVVLDTLARVCEDKP